MVILIFGLIIFLLTAPSFLGVYVVNLFIINISFVSKTSILIPLPFFMILGFFETPLAFKPTYLNMDLDLNAFSFTNLIVDIH